MPGIDLNYFMRQANKLTEKIEQRKKELAEETMEIQSGEGRVKVLINGVQEIRSLKIDPALIDPSDPAMLEDLLTAAVNSAVSASRERMQKELSKVSGGVKIPGIT
jgi:nucleoid-associated protein EbfC